jgi:hypothetical protein
LAHQRCHTCLFKRSSVRLGCINRSVFLYPPVIIRGVQDFVVAHVRFPAFGTEAEPAPRLIMTEYKREHLEAFILPSEPEPNLYDVLRRCNTLEDSSGTAVLPSNQSDYSFLFGRLTVTNWPMKFEQYCTGECILSFLTKNLTNVKKPTAIGTRLTR